MRRVIAGVDPGTTTGVAVLSFYGDLIFLGSFRGISPSDVEKIILQHGKPVILASDVAKSPKLIERLAAQLGAIPFSPRRDLTQREKDEIARRFGVKVDDHARDALAAAYTAWSHHWPKIQQVLRRLKDPDLVESIIERVIRGRQLVQLLEEEFRVEERKQEKVRRRESKEVVELRRKVSELMEERNRLKRLVERLKRKKPVLSRGESITYLEEKILSLKREKERLLEVMRELEKENEELKRRVEEAEMLIEKIRLGIKQGKVVGSQKTVKGEEISPGLVLGEPKRDPREELKEIIEEYRRKRRKELNLL